MIKTRVPMVLVSLVALAACAAPEQPAEEVGAVEIDDPEGAANDRLPLWKFDPSMIFPADASLNRPEDGVVLSDGRLVVADQIDGLRLVETDGSNRPFGQLPKAEYEHNPPEVVGGANGVNLSPDGTHILVADVFRGGIYRVDVDSEATEKVYQHTFGVNTARSDSHGGIWFSQSTQNRPEEGEAGLFRSVDVFVPDGAVFYIPPANEESERQAALLVDGLIFTNGLALDESNNILYVAETGASRVWRFVVDVEAGMILDRAVALEVDHPDNLELDAQGRPWIASPMRSELIVFDPSNETSQSVFRISTPRSEELLEEIAARLESGNPWLELMIPELWEPGPGLMTGLMLSPDDGPVFATSLGKAIIKLER